jgi:hypothetical protein
MCCDQAEHEPEHQPQYELQGGALARHTHSSETTSTSRPPPSGWRWSPWSSSLILQASLRLSRISSPSDALMSSGPPPQVTQRVESGVERDDVVAHRLHELLLCSAAGRAADVVGVVF